MKWLLNTTVGKATFSIGRKSRLVFRSCQQPRELAQGSQDAGKGTQFTSVLQTRCYCKEVHRTAAMEMTSMRRSGPVAPRRALLSPLHSHARGVCAGRGLGLHLHRYRAVRSHKERAALVAVRKGRCIVGSSYEEQRSWM